MGTVVALDGNTALSAAPFDTVDGVVWEGSVYVHTRSGTTWTQQQKLTYSYGHAGDALGYATAVDGDTVAVGAPNERSQGYAGLGAVYVFVRSGTAWTLQARLAPCPSCFIPESPYTNVDNVGFGTSVALQGNRLVIGAPGARNSSSTVTGGIWVYERSGTTWSFSARLFPTGGTTSGGPHLGASVSLDATTIVAGAKDESIGALTSAGAAYVYVLSSGTWSQQARIVASDAGYLDQLGRAAAVSGNVLLLGAPLNSSNRGAAYVFTRSGTTWGSQQKLVAGDGATGDNFGTSVALRGARALVGVPFDSSTTLNSHGSAYVFTTSGSTWTQSAKLTAQTPAESERFGTSVSLATDILTIGAPGAVISGKTGQGAAYVFSNWTGSWVQQGKLTASGGLAGDGLGVSIATTSRTAVVGANLDDRGVNLDQGSASVFALARTNGETCSDGTECQSGFCTGGVCCNAACNGACEACTTATGASANGTCTWVVGRSCDDNNKCTMGEVCTSAHTCAGTTVNPDDGNACTTDACDPSTGTSHAPLTGTSCNDGNACTQTDTCQSGTCTGGNAVVCTAQDTCHTAGTCNTSTGVCSNPVKANGSSCSDGNACTQTDSCQSGSCVGANSVVCPAPDQCHTAGTCAPATGVCSNPTKADGSSCSDGNACTQTDTCQSGTCSGTNPVVCTASDQCHDPGTCNTTSGTCSTSPAKSNGTACNDGNACTQTDTCQSGTCTGANPVTCAAPTACHPQGTCDSVTGCSQPIAATGTSCTDGNPCNGTEVCNATGTCLAGTPLVVDDGNPCTVDSCDSGGVHHVLVAVGTSCADNDVCNGNEACDAAGHCIGFPLAILDDNPCTVDSCDPVTGVHHVPASQGTSCDDGNACTPASSCDGQGHCLGTVGSPPVGTPTPTDCQDLTCDPKTGVFLTVPRVNATCCTSLSSFDTTVATTVVKAAQYLFDCGIQTGCIKAHETDESCLSPITAAIVRGRVRTREGAPILGVHVSVLGHPEFGSTVTRKDGADSLFELGVNGGTSLTLVYEHAGTTSVTGYLPAQRTLTVPPQGQVFAPDLVMIDQAPASTPVEVSSTGNGHDLIVDTATVVHGALSQDEAGVRHPRVLLKPGTVVKKEGETLSGITTLTLRTTEFTKGPQGPETMPGTLPPSSAYTYAAEFAFEELGYDKNITFENSTSADPVVVYLDNFLEIPPGVLVPVGYYDRDKAAWVGEQAGAVIVVKRENGVLKIDLDNDVHDTTPFETTAELLSFGIDSVELAHLGELLDGLFSTPTGDETIAVWRVPFHHFSAKDLNFNGGVPKDATRPTGGAPASGESTNDVVTCGSIIGCFRQTLGERFPVTGTGYTLAYQSERAPGYHGSASLRIPLSGSEKLPASLLAMRAVVDIAGTHTVALFAPAKNAVYDFTWAGVDNLGRRTSGAQLAQISVAWAYPWVYEYFISVSSLLGGGSGGGGGGGTSYAAITDTATKFGQPSASLETPPPDPVWSPPSAQPPGTPPPAITKIFISTYWEHMVAPNVFDHAKLGGLTFDVHHTYDAVGKVLHFGSGGKMSADSSLPVVTDIPFQGTSLQDDDITAMAADKLGNVYLSDYDGYRYRVQTKNCASSCVQSIPTVGEIPGDAYGRWFSMTTGADNSLYVGAGCRVLRYTLGTDGSLHGVRLGGLAVNTCSSTSTDGTLTVDATDGHPFRDAPLGYINDLTVGLDGTIYFVEQRGISQYLRRVAPNGLLSTVPLTHIDDPQVVSPTAPAPSTVTPYHVALAPDGTLYVSALVAWSGTTFTETRILRLSTAGVLSPYVRLDGPTVTSVVNDSTENSIVSLDPSGGQTHLAVDENGTLFFDTPGCLRFVDEKRYTHLAAGTEQTCRAAATNLAGLQDHAVGVGPATPIVGTLSPLLSTPRSDAVMYLETVVAGPGQSKRLRKLAPAMPGMGVTDFPVTVGHEQYVFDHEGRHLKTFDARTGELLASFTYVSHTLPSSSVSEKLLSTITDAQGKVTQIVRNANGVATSIVGPYGQTTTLDIQADELIHGLTNPASEETSFSYYPGLPTEQNTQYGLLDTLTDPRGNVHEFVYDTVGRLIEDRDPETIAAGVSSGHSYYKKLALTAGAEPTSTNNYTPRTDTVALETADGKKTSYLLTTQPTGEVHQIRSIQDHVDSTAAHDLVTTTVEKQDGTTQVSYPDGRIEVREQGPDILLHMQAPLVARATMYDGTRVARSEHTQTLTGTPPADPTQFSALTDTLTFSHCTVSTSQQPPTTPPAVGTCTVDGSVTSTLTRGVTAPTGSVLTGLVDQETTVTAGGVTRTVYSEPLVANQARHVLLVVPGLTNTLVTYDADGRLAQVTQGDRVQTYAYATANDVTQGLVKGALRTVTTQNTTTLETRSTVLWRDKVGRVTKTILPADGAQTRTVPFVFDAAGNLTSLTPPGQFEHAWDSYDGNNQPLEYLPPSLTGVSTVKTSYSYNLDRKLESITLPTNEVITFSYDGADRPKTVLLDLLGSVTMTYSDVADGSHGKLSSLDATWNLTDDEHLTFGYDSALPASVTRSGSSLGTHTATVSVEYDAAMRVSKQKLVTSSPNTEHDILVTPGPDNRVASTNSSEAILTPSYDTPSGLLTGTSLAPIPVGTMSLDFTMSNAANTAARSTYGEVDRLRYTQVNGSTVTTLFDETVTGRDGFGRIQTRTETTPSGTTTYGYDYDGAGRLWKVHENGVLVRSYTYDANGNRLQARQHTGGSESTYTAVTATYDGQDRMTHRTSSSGTNTVDYFYTADGRLTSKADPVVGTTSYAYDVMGNLRSATLPDSSVVTYTIDPMNRRIARRHGSTWGQQLMFSGLHPIAQLTDDGSDWKRHFVYGARGHVPEVMFEKNGATIDTYRLVTDHLGSLRRVIKLDATATVVQSMDYDEWGNVKTDSVLVAGFEPVPFGYAGGLYDRDTKLTRFGARDYDAESGRWTTKDPISLAGGTNVFAYASDNPINRIDVSGLLDSEGQFDLDGYHGNDLSFSQRASIAAGSLFVGLALDALVPVAAVTETTAAATAPVAEAATACEVAGETATAPPLYGPYIHHLNKGGLDKIVASGLLKAGAQGNAGFGGDGVRAYTSTLDQIDPGIIRNPVIEFMTRVAPVEFNTGQKAVGFGVSEIEIVILRILYPLAK